MSMKDLTMDYALSLLSDFYSGNSLKSSSFNNYKSQKLTGFTKVKGRRRLTKKQRKQLKSKKSNKLLCWCWNDMAEEEKVDFFFDLSHQHLN